MFKIVYMYNTTYKTIDVCHLKEPSSIIVIVYERSSTLIDQMDPHMLLDIRNDNRAGLGLVTPIPFPS